MPSFSRLSQIIPHEIVDIYSTVLQKKYIHEHLPSSLPEPEGQSLTVAASQSGRVPTAQTEAWELDHPAESGQMDWMGLQQSIGPILPSGPSPLDDQLHVPAKSIRSENNTNTKGNSLLFSHCTASCVST